MSDDYTSNRQTTGAVAVGGSATGDIELRGDRDWFAVVLEAGTTYRIELRGARTGDGTLSDPYLRGVYDASGNPIAGTADDDGGRGRNSLVFFEAQSAGTYFIAAGADGGDTGTYRLAVTRLADDHPADTGTTGTVAVGGSAAGKIETPHDRDWFTVVLEAGVRYRVDLEGKDTDAGTLWDPYLHGVYDAGGTPIADTADNDTGVGANSRLIFDAERAGTYYIAAGANHSDTGTYRVSVTDVTDDHPESPATTGAVAVGGSATGAVETAGDHDWFEVVLEAGKTYRVDLEGADTDAGTLSDPRLHGVYDADEDRVYGLTIRRDDGGVGRNSVLVFAPEVSGTYYIGAAAARGATGTYRVSVRELADDHPADTGTTGTVAVGGSATGEVEFANDMDWFAVVLDAGTVYRIDLEGADTDAGTLGNPYLRGVYDAAGLWVSGTHIDDGGTGGNSRLFFEPEASGTYYLGAGTIAGTMWSETGTYRVSVTALDDYPATNLTAGTVEVGGSARGEVEFAHDQDWFAVTLEAGRAYRIDLEGYWTETGTLRDPFLRGVHDAAGSLIAGTTADGGGTSLNSRLLFEPETAGTYYIAAGAGGSGTGTYGLSVTNVSDEDDHPAGTATTGTVAVGGSATGEIDFAEDQDWFAATLAAGRAYWIDIEGSDTAAGTLWDPYLRGVYDAAGSLIAGTADDDGGTSRNSRLLFVSETAGTHYIAAGAYGGSAGTYRVSVTEAEDDHSAGTGTGGTVAVGGSATGAIETAGDRDWFAVTLEAGKTYRVDLEGADTGAGTLSDPHLHGMFDANDDDVFGTTILHDGGVGRNSFLVFEPEASGTYYIGAGADGGETGTYRVSVTELADDHPADTGTTGTVAVGGSARGEVEFAYDHDWFAVALEAGTTYRIDLEGADTDAGTLGNPYLRGVYDAAGLWVGGAHSDDGGTGRNSRLYFEPEASGTYYLGAGGKSQLHAGTYRVSVTEVGDDEPGGAGPIGTLAEGDSARGAIERSGERDWFAVVLEAGMRYRFVAEGVDPDAGAPGAVHVSGVYDADGTLIAGAGAAEGGTGGAARHAGGASEASGIRSGGGDKDDGGESANGELDFAPAADGTYYVAAGGQGGFRGDYRISMARVDDDYAADTGTAGTVSVGGTATGAIETAYDRDWFKVTLEADKTYRIDLEGWSTWDGTLRDPYLRGVHDADGVFVAGTTDDDGGRGWNSRQFFTPDEAGIYYVVAGAYRDREGTYTLSVTDVTDDDYAADTDTTGTVSVGGSATGEIEKPADRDWFKVTLEADKTYRIDLEGRATGDGTLRDPYLRGVHDADGDLIAGTTDDDARGIGLNSRLYFTPDEAGIHYVAAGAYRGREGTYTLSVTDVTDDISDDYAADTGTTGTVSVGGSATGRINYERDRDWFEVALDARKTYRIDLEGADTDAGTLRDPILRGVHDADGDLIARTTDDDSGINFNSRQYFTPDETGTYYVAARAWIGKGTGTYTLSVTDVTDDISDDYAANTGTTGTVEAGGSAMGRIDYFHERDWFAVTLEAGKTYRIDLGGYRLGEGSLSDPTLHGVHDPAGNYIDGTRDFTSGPGLNSRIFFEPKSDGTYYISAGGTDMGTYRVSVSGDDDHPADTSTTATVEVGGSATGDIELRGDRDWFAVVLEAGTRYRIDLEGKWTRAGSLQDPNIPGIYDASGNWIGYNNDDGGVRNNSRVYFEPESDGTYYIGAGGYADYSAGTYELSVEEVI